MRIFAKVLRDGKESPSYVIPCKELNSTIADLKQSILERQSEKDSNSSELKLTLAGSEAVLSDQDLVQDVLQDGDVVQLSKSYKLSRLLCAVMHCIAHISAGGPAGCGSVFTKDPAILPSYGLYPPIQLSS